MCDGNWQEPLPDSRTTDSGPETPPAEDVSETDMSGGDGAAAQSNVPGSPTGMDLLRALGILLVIELAAGFLLGVLLAAAGVQDAVAVAMVCQVPVFSLAMLAVSYHFVCRKYGRGFRDGFALRRPALGEVLAGVGVAVGLAAVMILVQVLRMIGGGGIASDAPMVRVAGSSSIMPVMALWGILVPFVEELFFRGFVLSVLRKKLGVVLAVVLTTAWFAAAHAYQLGFDLMSLCIIAVLGGVFAIQRCRTGSLVQPIVTHTVYNAVLMGLGLIALGFSSSSAPVPAAHGERPTAADIQQDLVGHSVGRMPVWRFDSVDEFAEFDIREQQEQGGRLEYEVDVRLSGSIPPDATAKIQVTYVRREDGWVLLRVTDNGTLRLESAR